MIFLARTGANKSDLRDYVSQRGYTLAIDPDGFKSSEVFLTAEFTTQAAILSMLESSSFEDCIRRAVLDDGDTDTQAAIAGSIAEAMYDGVPDEIEAEVFTRLKPWMTRILGEYRGQEV
jgi:ADP-ribosylglycohydrolase